MKRNKLEVGEAVTYICHDYTHNALVCEINKDGTVNLLHMDWSYTLQRWLPQFEINVPRETPDNEGRCFVKYPYLKKGGRDGRAAVIHHVEKFR